MRIQMGRRLAWLGAVILLILGSLGGRLYDLQVIKGPAYARMAYDQRTLTLPVADQRGLILDRNGVPLSDPQPGWGVAYFPPLVIDDEWTAVELADALHRSESDLLETIRTHVQKLPRQPFWLAKGIAKETADAVEQLRLPGVAVGPAGERYGTGALARNLIGYINDEGGNQGLEQAFDKELTGEAVPSLVATLGGNGKVMQGSGIRMVVPGVSKPPYQIDTTLDARLQAAVERVLDSHHYPGGKQLPTAVVVVEPNSGDVLAMASRPQFDYPELDSQLSGQSGEDTFLLNRAVTAFAPGSAFKTIVAAAALEQKKVSMNEEFVCDGHYSIGNDRFGEPDPHGHGRITFAEAIAESCNITFLKVGYERLGTKALRDAALRFGFGSPTDVLGRPWPEEQAGTVPQANAPGAVQMAFGQGELSATPLQMARAYAAVANGGVLPGLRLVKDVKSPTGEVVQRPAVEQARRVISRQTARALQDALKGVTEPDGVGTGKNAWIPVIGSAGKTGSAEGKDTKGRDTVHAWFAGYLPATGTPKYVVVVFVEGGRQGGGAVAAPIFREVGQALDAVGP